MRAFLPIAVALVSACTFDYQSLRKGGGEDGAPDVFSSSDDGVVAPVSPDGADVALGSGGTAEVDARAGGGGALGTGGMVAAGGAGAGGAAGRGHGGAGGIGPAGGTTSLGGRGSGGAVGNGGTQATGGTSVGPGTGGGSGGTTMVNSGGTGMGGMATGGVSAGSGGSQTGGTTRMGGNTGTGGAGGAGGASGCTSGSLGPSGYCWDLFHAPGANAAWADTPGPSSVHVSAQSSTDGNGGMFAALGGGAPVDLSGYDQLWFDATVPNGQRFAVSIGNKSKGEYCHWELVGSGSARYSIDLRTAKLCWPNSCSLSRSAIREVSFYSAEWSASYVLDMTLTRMGFATTVAGFGPATAGYAAQAGLNGWCWSLFSWSGTAASEVASTVAWVAAPTSTQVQAQVTDTDNNGNAGCSVQLPEGQGDLSEASYLSFDASVTLTSAVRFGITLEDVNRATANFEVTVLPGTSSYKIPLASPAYVRTGGGVAYDSHKVCTIDFGTLWTLTASGNITITRLAIE